MKNNLRITINPSITGIKFGVSFTIQQVNISETFTISWLDIITVIDWINDYWC